MTSEMNLAARKKLEQSETKETFAAISSVIQKGPHQVPNAYGEETSQVTTTSTALFQTGQSGASFSGDLLDTHSQSSTPLAEASSSSTTPTGKIPNDNETECIKKFLKLSAEKFLLDSKVSGIEASLKQLHFENVFEKDQNLAAEFQPFLEQEGPCEAALDMLKNKFLNFERCTLFLMGCECRLLRRHVALLHVEDTLERLEKLFQKNLADAKHEEDKGEKLE